jgi:ribonuclease E
VREPRPKRDEVTAVKGSTRLEAKKLRRREGREAGRRRTVITEAEFLARRESVERVMVVRHKQDRSQIGVLEDGVLVEHYVSRETNASMAGNVYLGRIQNVLPSMEAAFVDIGKGRNAVLYAGEVNWDAAGLDNRAKRIENALSSGQAVLVQVTKDPIGHKGARLTSQVSLPGRYLVYVPDGNMMGISRKLPDTERARLKKILREVVPENAGVIVRTAAEGASEEELRADVTRLTAVWNEIQAKAKSANAPALLHGEPDLTVRVIRDVFNEDFAKLVVSGEPAWDAVSGYVNTVAPDLADRIQRWTGEQDLFTHYRVDEQIAKAMDRKVWLPSGGTLVIDRTEAMTVVDVNTGKFVGSGGNLEETVTKNNIEAAEEVVRQLRLRDIGGIIVIDFIDMVLESNRDLVVRRLLECLGRDRTKHQVAEVTSLGLVQMTRKRVGAGLIEVFSHDCEHCNGRGIIVSADPIERPAGSDGSSGGGNGSGGANNGAGGNSGDGGGGRGTRGRRARGTGADTSVTLTPEPPAPTGGPTPAQIAAAAHAAAIQGTAQREAVESVAAARSPEQAESPAPAAPLAEAAPGHGDGRPSQSQTDLPATAAVVVAEPKKPRRRSSRSAKSPAFSVNPGASAVSVAPVEAEPVVALNSFEPPASRPQGGPFVQAAKVAEAGEAKAPAVLARRKRPRVVAPAGPPRGASQSEAASGEFGS